MTSWAEFLMRISLGAVFLNAGIGKLFFNVRPPIDKIITFIPADTTLILLGLLGFVIGALFLLGLFTKLTGKVATALLIVIILSGFYIGMGPLYKDIALFAASWHLANVGSKKYALDSFF